MFRNQKTIFFLVILSCCMMMTTLAGERGAFSSIGFGAKPLGMGGAFAAVADTADALYWNPAGLAQIPSGQLSTMQTSLFGMGIQYHSIAITKQVAGLNLAFGKNTLDAGAALIDFPYREDSNIIGLAKPWVLKGRELLVGANFKYNSLAGGSSDVYSKQAGFGIDTGIYMKQGAFSLGFVVRDLYTKLTGNLKVDGEDRDVSTVIKPDLTLGFAWQRNNLTVAMDLGELQDNRKLHLGVDYKVNELVSIRGGYTEQAFTCGLGLQKERWIFNYAYNLQEAGDAQRFSLGFVF